MAASSAAPVSSFSSGRPRPPQEGRRHPLAPALGRGEHRLHLAITRPDRQRPGAQHLTAFAGREEVDTRRAEIVGLQGVIVLRREQLQHQRVAGLQKCRDARIARIPGGDDDHARRLGTGRRPRQARPPRVSVKRVPRA